MAFLLPPQNDCFIFDFTLCASFSICSAFLIASTDITPWSGFSKYAFSSRELRHLFRVAPDFDLALLIGRGGLLFLNSIVR
jgi:hypothetical protein